MDKLIQHQRCSQLQQQFCVSLPACLSIQVLYISAWRLILDPSSRLSLLHVWAGWLAFGWMLAILHWWEGNPRTLLRQDWMPEPHKIWPILLWISWRICHVPSVCVSSSCLLWATWPAGCLVIHHCHSHCSSLVPREEKLISFKTSHNLTKAWLFFLLSADWSSCLISPLVLPCGGCCHGSGGTLPGNVIIPATRGSALPAMQDVSSPSVGLCLFSPTWITWAMEDTTRPGPGLPMWCQPFILVSQLSIALCNLFHVSVCLQPPTCFFPPQCPLPCLCKYREKLLVWKAASVHVDAATFPVFRLFSC